MNVAVLGESVMDLVAGTGSATYTAVPGGSPYNVAIGLGRLDRHPLLLTRLSHDGFGRMLRRHALANGVDLSSAVSTSAPSALAVASLDESGHASYTFYGETAGDGPWTSGLDSPVRVLQFGSIASWRQPGGDHAVELVDRIRSGGALITFDPNIRPDLIGDRAEAVTLVGERIRLAHVVKASDEDVRWLYPDVDPLTAVREWLDLGPSLVVLTRGAAGALAVTSHGVHASRATQPVPVVDTVGAGDAFTAGLIDALLTRQLAEPATLAAADAGTLRALLDVAGTIAELTCARRGADPPTRAEADRRIALNA